MRTLQCAAFAAALSTAAGAQVPAAGDSLLLDTAGIRVVPDSRQSRLAISSGKTYNRVEGLPIHVGPVFTDSSRYGVAAMSVFGIFRTADEFRWDAGNVGHLVRAEFRTHGARSYAVRIAAYDVVDAIEKWQLPAGETGIATFLFHRDYRDYYGRHGASVAFSALPGVRTRFDVEYADERWTSRESREVFTVWRNNHAWRANPRVDDGRARVLTLGARIDTRNDPRNPWLGWLTTIEYERGRARIDSYGPTSSAARLGMPPTLSYGRLLLDARRYNRVSTETQLNFRLVAGGWLHGDELPLQRRLSVGGAGTIPGVDFREVGGGTDVSTCSDGSPPPGKPAQCERVLLFQVEYRDELPFRPGTIFGGTPIRIRSAALTLRPTLVAFADVGRGWLVTPQDRGPMPISIGAPGAGRVYETNRLPRLDTFHTDVGIGVDLGLFGVYAAKSVSDAGEPINVVLRARARF